MSRASCRRGPSSAVRLCSGARYGAKGTPALGVEADDEITGSYAPGQLEALADEADVASAKTERDLRKQCERATRVAVTASRVPPPVVEFVQAIREEVRSRRGPRRDDVDAAIVGAGLHRLHVPGGRFVYGIRPGDPRIVVAVPSSAHVRRVYVRAGERLVPYRIKSVADAALLAREVLALLAT